MTKATRARYTLEFKQEAVRLVEGGQSIAAAARTLGVVEQTLFNWVKGKRGFKALLTGAARGLQQGAFAIVDFVDEHVIRPSQTDGLVQALEQSVEALAVAAHEHREAVAAIGGRGRALVRRQRPERDLATFPDQGLDMVRQSHLPLRP